MKFDDGRRKFLGRGAAFAAAGIFAGLKGSEHPLPEGGETVNTVTKSEIYSIVHGSNSGIDIWTPCMELNIGPC